MAAAAQRCGERGAAATAKRILASLWHWHEDASTAASDNELCGERQGEGGRAGGRAK